MIAYAKTLDTLVLVNKEVARVDSRLLASSLHKSHKDLMALIHKYVDRLRGFGHLPFQKEVGAREQGGGNAARFALLNEDQSLFLLTLSRNTDRTVDLKAKLVKAFGEARRAAETGTEYLPTYHALHDEIHTLSAGSTNERFVHMNLNKLLNKTVGIEAGQRHRLDQAPRAFLIVAQAVAAQAMHGATDHHQGYERAKLAMAPLAQLSIGGAA